MESQFLDLLMLVLVKTRAGGVCFPGFLSVDGCYWCLGTWWLEFPEHFSLFSRTTIAAVPEERQSQQESCFSTTFFKGAMLVIGSVSKRSL